MSIDIDTARRIARLARIDVPETALPGVAADLSAFLAWVDQLAEVAVDGVEPMTSVTPMALMMRADVVSDGDMRDAILANAPAAQAGFFVVPKVVE